MTEYEAFKAWLDALTPKEIFQANHKGLYHGMWMAWEARSRFCEGLLPAQQTLGADFQKVLSDNLWILYVTDDSD